MKENLRYFEGPFTSWEDAKLKSSGYEDEKILEKVLQTSLEVQKGTFAFERDSVGFKKLLYDWHLVAAILRTAIGSNGCVSVLDIGGSLGSSYFQHLSMLKDCNLSWHVVEQAHFVRAGKKHFESAFLKFHDSIDSCTISNSIDLVLFSSVLQYLKSPETFIKKATLLGAQSIIIDKTVVNNSDEHRIYLQNVPDSIYHASYPCRSISEKWLFKNLSPNYTLLCDFNSLPFPELNDIDSRFKGYHFTKLQ